jgi:hypothetical protein
MLAKLGGFLGRKCDGFLGPKAIWIGLQRLRDFMWAIQQYQTAASLACAGSWWDVYKDERGSVGARKRGVDILEQELAEVSVHSNLGMRIK